MAFLHSLNDEHVMETTPRAHTVFQSPSTAGSAQPQASPTQTALSNYLESQATPVKRTPRAAASSKPGLAAEVASPPATRPIFESPLAAIQTGPAATEVSVSPPTSPFGPHAHCSAVLPAPTEADAEITADLELRLKLLTPMPDDPAPPTNAGADWTTRPVVRELPKLSVKTFAGRGDHAPDFHPRREVYLALMSRVPELPAKWVYLARDYWKHLSNHSDLTREAAAFQWAQEQRLMPQAAEAATGVEQAVEKPEKKKSQAKGRSSAGSKSKSAKPKPKATAKSVAKGKAAKAKANSKVRQSLRQWSQRFQARKAAQVALALRWNLMLKCAMRLGYSCIWNQQSPPGCHKGIAGG